jgi:hypothetical protein
MGQKFKPRQQDRSKNHPRDFIPDGFIKVEKRDKRKKREQSWENDLPEDFER